ncbi:MAG: phosphodiester glycosidase family protein [Anaerolineae bacterium]|nr:phosphodiester glycosidase family protein [Anaerolineae bacterium]
MHKKIAVTVGFVLLTALFAACGPVDPNATPIVMFPTRVATSNLPTFPAGGTSLPVVPTVPLPSSVAPTLVLPTQPAFTYVPPTPVAPTVVPTIDANWNQLSAGINWRVITFRAPSSGQVASVLVTRIDPRYARFKVYYQAGAVRNIQQWQSVLPGAVAIVNANFFDTQNRPLGLVASDGILTGVNISRNDTGVFQLKDNVARVRSFYTEPYNNTENFQQVVQGLPMLMVAGRVAPAFNPDISTAPSFRTVIAQDVYGRILIIVTQYTAVTLLDMARFLGVSGLEITTALNMDGGSSTQMYLATGGPSQFTIGGKGVPVVLAVFR